MISRNGVELKLLGSLFSTKPFQKLVVSTAMFDFPSVSVPPPPLPSSFAEAELQLQLELKLNSSSHAGSADLPCLLPVSLEQ